MDITTTSVKPLLGLDPRTKLLTLLVVAGFGFTGFFLPVELLQLAVLSFFLLSYHIKTFTFKMASVYLVMVAFELAIVPLLDGWLGVIFLALVKAPRTVLLIIMAAQLLIKTTSVSEFTAAFQKMHIPSKIIIPFSVMFRFIPTIKEEWGSIRNAMRLRGISVSPLAVARAPLQTLEYGMVPLLMSVATISSELAAASLSRGLDASIKRTSLTVVRMKLVDYAMIILCVAYAVFQMVA